MTKDVNVNVISRALAGLERSIETDDAATAARERLSRLEQQAAERHTAATEAAQRLEQLTTASIETVRNGDSYDSPGLEKARLDAAAKAASHNIIEAALSDQRARVAALDRQRADRVAEQLRPVLSDALKLSAARLTEMAEADSLVERLHKIAQQELYTSHADLTAGYCFTTSTRIAGWRERVRTRFAAAVEA